MPAALPGIYPDCHCYLQGMQKASAPHLTEHLRVVVYFVPFYDSI